MNLKEGKMAPKNPTELTLEEAVAFANSTREWKKLDDPKALRADELPILAAMIRKDTPSTRYCSSVRIGDETYVILTERNKTSTTYYLKLGFRNGPLAQFSYSPGTPSELDQAGVKEIFEMVDRAFAKETEALKAHGVEAVRNYLKPKKAA